MENSNQHLNQANKSKLANEQKPKRKDTFKQVLKIIGWILLIVIFNKIWYVIVGLIILWYYGKHERAKNRAIMEEWRRLGIKAETHPMEKRWYDWQLKLPRQSKWYGVIAFAVFGIFIVLMGYSMYKNSKNEIKLVTQAQRAGMVKTGDTAKLRLPGPNDPSLLICLGATEADHEKVVDAMVAKDAVSLLSIPGAFCVHNGASVILLEDGLLRRRVRIDGVIDEVDKDKIGRSGLVDREFVLPQ